MAGINSVLIVFSIITIGFIFEMRKLWPADMNKTIASIVMNVGAPALGIISFSTYFNRQMLVASFKSAMFILVSVFIVYLTARALSTMLKLDIEKKAVFQVMFTFTNTIFIGLPVNEIIFGNQSLPYVFIYFSVSITLFWTLGVFTIRNASKTEKSKRMSILDKILTPGLAGVIIGIIIAGADIEMNMVLEKALTYLGNICVPLSLMMIGSNLAKSGLKKIHRPKLDVIIIIASKILVGPAIIYFVMKAVGVTGLELSVYIMMSAMPCHVQSAIMAEYYMVAGDYAAELVAVTTLLTIIYIPILALLLG